MDFIPVHFWRVLLSKFTICASGLIISLIIAWAIHMLQPAFSSGYSSKYATCTWPRGKPGLRQYYRTAYECLTRPRGLFNTAYEALCRSAMTMILMPLPHSAQGFLFLLPVELLDEFTRQPEKIISLHAYTREVMHPKYTTFGENFVDNPVHYPVVYRELGQNLGNKTVTMNDETVKAIIDVLGPQLDESGRLSVNMWDVSLKLLTRISNRIVIGPELCTNTEYINANRHYSDNMFTTGLAIRMVPSFLRPVLAPLIQRPLLKDREIVAKHTIPIIKERMRVLDEAELAGSKADLPNDLLSATLRVARNHPQAQVEYTPRSIVHRIMGFNFLQTWTQALTLTNAIFDLISLPVDLFNETISLMRAEISAGLGQTDGQWSKDMIESLEVCDSFLRESMRWNSIGEVGIERNVVAPNGFTFSNGLHVPCGATLAAPNRSIQRDPERYPGGFDPKRALKDPERPRATTISKEFLNFGLGRPACPGRWFAVDLLKLVIGHLVMDYDFERMETRPKNVRKLTIYEPSTEVEIGMRKRV